MNRSEKDLSDVFRKRSFPHFSKGHSLLSGDRSNPCKKAGSVLPSKSHTKIQFYKLFCDSKPNDHHDISTSPSTNDKMAIKHNQQIPNNRT